MDCSYATLISLYVDGELDAAERGRTEEHLAACDACRRARDEYLAIRARLAPLDEPADRVAQQRALRDILARSRERVWRRRVSIPVPVAAVAAAALLAAAAALATRGPEPPTPPAATPARAAAGMSRFDRGGRPAIVVRPVDENEKGR